MVLGPSGKGYGEMGGAWLRSPAQASELIPRLGKDPSEATQALQSPVSSRSFLLWDPVKAVYRFYMRASIDRKIPKILASVKQDCIKSSAKTTLVL